MAKQITGTTAQAVELKAGQPQTIKIAKGQQLRIQELVNGQMKDAGKVVSSRKGKDLQVKFADGSEVIFENFFVVCVGDACSVTVGDSQLGSFSITADTPMGDQLPDGSQLVHYSSDEGSSLMQMASQDSGFIKTQAPAQPKDNDAGAVIQTQGGKIAASGDFPSSALLLGGLALGLGAGGGGSKAPIVYPDGYKGVVWDTPVKNAIVFRDTNGDGIWDSNEPITITRADGTYTGLNGSGNIVATSLDRLVWKTEAVKVVGANLVTETLTFEGAQPKLVTVGATQYTIETLKIGSVEYTQNSQLRAVDIGSNLKDDSPSSETGGDDFVWSGTYIINAALQQGSVEVYVTAVSTLVKAYLAEKGLNNPDKDQVYKAVSELQLVFNEANPTAVTDQTSLVKFLTGDLNQQITRLMGETIAKAQSENSEQDPGG